MGIPKIVTEQTEYNLENMKLFVATFVALAAADKKVPPRHPLQRLTKLNNFAVEWTEDNLTEKQADNWSAKFERNTARLQKRFDLCGFYDEESASSKSLADSRSGPSDTWLTARSNRPKPSTAWPSGSDNSPTNSLRTMAPKKKAPEMNKYKSYSPRRRKRCPSPRETRTGERERCPWEIIYFRPLLSRFPSLLRTCK